MNAMLLLHAALDASGLSEEEFIVGALGVDWFEARRWHEFNPPPKCVLLLCTAYLADPSLSRRVPLLYDEHRSRV